MASTSTDSASLPISSTANESDIDSTSDLEVEESHDQESNPVVSLLDRLKCPTSAEIAQVQSSSKRERIIYFFIENYR